MKKLVSLLALLLAAGTYSCNNSGSNEEKTDSTKAFEISPKMADSTVNDGSGDNITMQNDSAVMKGDTLMGGDPTSNKESIFHRKKLRIPRDSTK